MEAFINKPSYSVTARLFAAQLTKNSSKLDGKGSQQSAFQTWREPTQMPEEHLIALILLEKGLEVPKDIKRQRQIATPFCLELQMGLREI